jgi:hypothetical protein
MKLRIVPGRQLEPAMLSQSPCAPGLFRRLDLFPRRGDEVPPDIARPVQRLTAQEHDRAPWAPAFSVIAGRRGGTPSSARPRTARRPPRPSPCDHVDAAILVLIGQGQHRTRRHHGIGIEHLGAHLPAPSPPGGAEDQPQPLALALQQAAASSFPCMLNSARRPRGPSAGRPRSGCRKGIAHPDPASPRSCVRNG